MKRTILLSLFILLLCCYSYAQENKFVRLSQNLLQEIRDSKDYNNTVFSIANINPDSLARSLYNDDLRKAFWINIYNAIAQLSISNEYQSTDALSPFPYKKTWIVAQRYISLHEISSCILKHRQFPNKYDKRFQLDTTDPQIPFALNFGAKDCPPIHIFTSDNINEQLYKSANRYIVSNCTWTDGGFKVLYAPSFFERYYGNFGRHYGLALLMVKFGVMPDGEDFDYLAIKHFNTLVEKRKFARE